MTSMTSDAGDARAPDYASVPGSAFGLALNVQGRQLGRVERNPLWIPDGTYQAARLTPDEGVVLFDATPVMQSLRLDNGVGSQVNP